MLSHPEKAARLKDIAENWHYIGGSWTASVVSVTDTEREEEVYDLYEPDTLTWITNGYCSLDCGSRVYRLLAFATSARSISPPSSKMARWIGNDWQRSARSRCASWTMWLMPTSTSSMRTERRS